MDEFGSLSTIRVGAEGDVQGGPVERFSWQSFRPGGSYTITCGPDEPEPKAYDIVIDMRTLKQRRERISGFREVDAVPPSVAKLWQASRRVCFAENCANPPPLYYRSGTDPRRTGAVVPPRRAQCQLGPFFWSVVASDALSAGRKMAFRGPAADWIVRVRRTGGRSFLLLDEITPDVRAPRCGSIGSSLEGGLYHFPRRTVLVSSCSQAIAGSVDDGALDLGAPAAAEV